MSVKRAEILESALEHFAAVGFDASSLSKIAKTLEIDLAQLAVEFEDIDELFHTSMNWAFTELIEDLYKTHNLGEEPPVTRLLMMVNRLGNNSPIERMALFVILRELIEGNPRLQPVLYHGPVSEGLDILLQTLSEAQFRGQLNPMPPRFIITVLLSALLLPNVLGFDSIEQQLQGTPALRAKAESWTNGQNALFTGSLNILLHGLLPTQTPLMKDPKS